jgi:hypothetical protein
LNSGIFLPHRAAQIKANFSGTSFENAASPLAGKGGNGAGWGLRQAITTTDVSQN